MNRRPRTIADAIRAELAELGLSQRAAARALGIDERTMRDYCADGSPAPACVLLALRQLAQVGRNEQVIRMLDSGVMTTSDGAATRDRLAECNVKLLQAMQFLMRRVPMRIEFPGPAVPAADGGLSVRALVDDKPVECRFTLEALEDVNPAHSDRTLLQQLNASEAKLLAIARRKILAGDIADGVVWVFTSDLRP